MIPDKPWKFRRVSFGPGVPRVDVEPLDLPAAAPAPTADRCWLCLGKGDNGDGEDCPACLGRGQIERGS